MNIKNSIVIFLLYVMLGGCAVRHPIRTINDVYSQTTVEVDQYRKTTWINGPTVYEGEGLDLGWYYASLRAFGEENSVSFYQLYISDYQEGWRFYNNAYDANGEQLNFIEIDRTVIREARAEEDFAKALTEEDFAIFLSRQYLESAKITGLNIKAFGKRGEKVFILPGYYIEGFLQKVDTYTKNN